MLRAAAETDGRRKKARNYEISADARALARRLSHHGKTTISTAMNQSEFEIVL
mgnify:CR=1 FL=1